MTSISIADGPGGVRRVIFWTGCPSTVAERDSPTPVSTGSASPASMIRSPPHPTQGRRRHDDRAAASPFASSISGPTRALSYYDERPYCRCSNSTTSTSRSAPSRAGGRELLASTRGEAHAVRRRERRRQVDAAQDSRRHRASRSRARAARRRPCSITPARARRSPAASAWCFRSGWRFRTSPSPPTSSPGARSRGAGGRLDEPAMHARTRDLLDRLQIPIAPDAADGARLGGVRAARAGGARARVRLPRPRARRADDVADRRRGRSSVRGARRTCSARGVTLLFVSHRLPEVFRLCDRITVLRDGEFVGTFERATSTPRHDRAGDGRPRAARARRRGRRSIATRRRRSPSAACRGVPCFEDVSLDVRPGEIVGIFGLVGSGPHGAARDDLRPRADPIGGEVMAAGEAGAVPIAARRDARRRRARARRSPAHGAALQPADSPQHRAAAAPPRRGPGRLDARAERRWRETQVGRARDQDAVASTGSRTA